MIKRGITKTGSFADQLIEAIDFDSNGMINYSEFLSATLGSQVLNEEKLQKLFNLFDEDQTGILKAENLLKVFRRFGKQFDLKEVQQFLEDAIQG